jgi:hypothetical protein
MYTGTLIEDLIKTVERAEEHVQEEAEEAMVQEVRLSYWYAAAQREMSQLEQTLAGVA